MSQRRFSAMFALNGRQSAKTEHLGDEKKKKKRVYFYILHPFNHRIVVLCRLKLH